jgi:hypothetical protein
LPSYCPAIADRADIDRALEELPVGSDVRVVMKDRSELAGKFMGSDAETLTLGQGDAELGIDKETVESILIEDSTDPPE